MRRLYNKAGRRITGMLVAGSLIASLFAGVTLNTNTASAEENYADTTEEISEDVSEESTEVTSEDITTEETTEITTEDTQYDSSEETSEETSEATTEESTEEAKPVDTIDEGIATYKDDSAEVAKATGLSAAEFEVYMDEQGFPETYKPKLRTLHAQHPNWIFQAVQTGVDWDDAVSHEVNTPSNVVSVFYDTSSNPHYNWRSTNVGYDYLTDTWQHFHGSTFYAASDELVMYYMDPRTYFDEENIFSFESLKYSSTQTEAGVRAVLNGSFLANGKPANASYTYAHAIYLAARQSGVSAYHIASRIKLEVGGTPNSQLVNGTNPSYPGIYNFYNIGAYGSSDSGIILGALKYAASSGSYGRPWNSPYKAILGGALFLGNDYILQNQDTIYTQKFNVCNSSNRYWHQYMSNVQVCPSESYRMYQAYRECGLLNSQHIFKIPIYNNLPQEPAVLPPAKGNPNNYLKNLTIAGFSLSPAFKCSTTTDYSLTVGASKDCISIVGTPVNKYARIAGSGIVNLDMGVNKVPITVYAQSGATRVYTITVTRGRGTETGFFLENELWYYYKNGKVDTSVNGFYRTYTGAWVLLKNGKQNTNFTGLYKHYTGSWFYLKDGRLHSTFTGLVKHTSGSWYYVENGKLMNTVTGMVKHNTGIYYYVKNGRMDTGVNGLTKCSNGWYYFVSGRMMSNYTGLVTYNGAQWYVKDGKMQNKYSGKVTISGKTYKILKGKVQ
ncbi:dockerin type I repeat protein [Coprococcus sp. CAG:782]|nr:dockerin type I repeat protein [Coprococcus sp. CAG:782]